MFRRWAAALGVAALCGFVHQARADVVVTIDKSAQQMIVEVDGAQAHVWPVSTGRAGFGTPNGRFRPQWLARRHFSRKYYNSPMPHSIFFHKGYAIHGTTYIRRLGGTASHGCVRLHPQNAAILFGLVSRYGKANTRIVVTGGSATRVAQAKRARIKSASAAAPARPAVVPARLVPAPQPRFLFDDFFAPF